MNQQEIFNDFVKRYNKTFVFVEFPEESPSLSGKEALFFIEALEGASDVVGTLQLSSDEYGKIRLNFGTDHKIKFKFPKMGVFQNGKEAYCVRRNPLKQYRRGVCADNCTFLPVVSNVYARRIELSFEIVSAAFDGITFSFEEALRMLATEKYLSVALKDNFSLSLSTTTRDKYCLFYWDSPIAFLEKNGSLFTLYEKVFSSEVAALTAPHFIPF